MTDSELKKEKNIDVDVNDNKDDKKKKKAKSEPMQRVSLKTLFRYATTTDYILMTVGTIGGIAQGAIMPSFSLIFGLILDAFNDLGPDFLDRITEVALYFLWAGLGAMAATYAQSGFWNWTSARQNNVIRNEYLKAILRQEVAWFDQTPSGELTTRIVGDTIIIQEAMGEKIGTFLQYMSTGIFGFALGFTKSWKLSLVMLAVTPLLAVCGAFMMKMMAALTEQGQTAYAKAGAFAAEVIAGIRTVASFASEPAVATRYKVGLKEAKLLGIRSAVVGGTGIGITMFIFFGVYGLALWYGSTLVANGEISGGDVLTVFFSVLIGAFALGQASPSMESLSKGQGAAFKIYATIDRQTQIDASTSAGKRSKNVKGNIQFKDVCFTYPNRPDQTVFRGLNLDIQAGQKVAIVGHSGSGKSTTIQMILRFYDPDVGAVTLDGKNIKKFNLYWYRNQIGLVGQEPVLFSGTIGENIAYGKPGASQEEIEEAAKMSNAHKFISEFPDGYNTQVGEKGAQLSGGQKQRIAIARAIIKNPKILLLDEATSALDTESEKVVQDALDSVMKGRTTIIVAHRLSTIRDADKIVVISKGSVAEQGNHEELIEKKGHYYDLVQSQTGGVSYEKSSKNLVKKEEKTEKAEDVKAAEEKFEEEVKAKKVPISRILALNKNEAGYLAIGCLAAAINGSVQPIFSILFSEMVTLFYQPADEIRENSWKWALGFAAIGFAPLICFITQSTMFAIAGQRLIEKLRDMCFKAILRHDIGWFDRKENNTGALTARLASEATLVETAVGPRLGILSQNVATMIAGLVIAFIYGWKLTLVVLATSPLLAFANAMQMTTMKSYTDKLRKANESGNQVAMEAIMNIRTVYAFTREDFVFEIYKDRMEKPVHVQMVNAHIKGLLLGVGQLVLFGSYTLSFWYGGKLITDGEYNFEQVLKVFMAVIMLAMGVGQAAGLAPDTGKAAKAASVIFTIVDDVPVIDSSSTEGITNDGIKGDIDLENVKFHYPTRPDTKVLKGMNLSIKTGQVVALVGHSGCGKSSTVGLLERYYDAIDGEVKIDGVNVKDYNLRWLRQQIGLVGQEPILFSGTIAENIAYGKPGSSQEEIETAAKASNAHNFISEFPDGYNTQVGEKGAQLSGGQKQRIAIARAIIKNPKILLLDEATSALDAESEKVVQAALDSVMKGRTTLIIAHRLTTIRNADMICVIENGKVKEKGTHDDLMKMEGSYYNLVIRQTA